MTLGRARVGFSGWAAALAVGAAMAWAAATGWAQLSLQARGWQQDTHGRLVMDFTEAPDYSATREGNEITLSFEEPLEGRIDPALQRLRPQIRNARLGDDGRTVTLILNRDFVANDFASGSAVVVDFIEPGNESAYTEATGRDITPIAEADETASAPQDDAASPADGEGSAQVLVRTGAHNGYDRLVFEWPEPVSYELGRRDGQVRIEFDRPGEPVDDGLNLDAMTHIGDVAFSQGEDGLVAAVTVPPDAAARHFRLDNRVVFDALAGNEDPPAEANLDTTIEAAEPDTASAEAPAVAPPEDGTGEAAAATAPAPDPESGGDGGGGQADAQAGTDLAQAGDGANGNQGGDAGDTAPSSQTGQGEVTDPPAPPSDTDNGIGDLLDVPVDPMALTDLTSSPGSGTGDGMADSATMDDPAPGGEVTVPDEPAESEERAPTLAETVPVAAEIPIELDTPASLAAFRRAGYLWLVFGREVAIDGRAILDSAGALLGPPEGLSAENATALRMPLQEDVYPRLDREGRTWFVELREAWVPPRIDLQVEPQPDFSLGARVLIHSRSADQVLQIRDPEVGDTLAVAPLPAPGRGIGARRRYPEAEILRSAQGVAVAPLSDIVEVAPVEQGVEITTPDGLHMSEADIVETLQGEARDPLADRRRLFDFQRWRRGGAETYQSSKEALSNQVAMAPEADKNADRLTLARFFLANAVGNRARGVLDVVIDDAPEVLDPVTFRALDGATHIMNGRPEKGLERLRVAQLDDEPEAHVWRAIGEGRRGNWGEAMASLQASQDILLDYPPELRRALIPQAVEIAWRAGNLDMAARYLDALPEAERQLMAQATDGETYDVDPENPEFGDPVESYWRGRIQADRGETETAIETLVPATRSRDLLHRFLAGQLRTELMLDSGQISVEEAVARLEDQRFDWRGDYREFELLRTLGETYWQAENYRDAFETLREAVSSYPDHPAADGVADGMTRRFAELFDDGAEHLPIETALNLYQDYRELAPPGPEGDRLERELADRLIDFGLLGRGGDLLAHQVQERLEGRQRLEVGTRLAAVRLLDDDPEAALEALEASRFRPTPAEIAQERRVLRAQAQAETGQVDEALTTLSGLTSDEERLLYTNIAWRNQRWDAAANGLEALLAERQPVEELDEETSRYILNLGIARLLGGDEAGVSELAEQYGDRMLEGPDADAFRIVARGEGLADTDLENLNEQMAEVADFRRFLGSYRENLLNDIAETDTAAES